jgi:hypothetical protein
MQLLHGENQLNKTVTARGSANDALHAAQPLHLTDCSAEYGDLPAKKPSQQNNNTSLRKSHIKEVSHGTYFEAVPGRRPR